MKEKIICFLSLEKAMPTAFATPSMLARPVDISRRTWEYNATSERLERDSNARGCEETVVSRCAPSPTFCFFFSFFSVRITPFLFRSLLIVLTIRQNQSVDEGSQSQARDM